MRWLFPIRADESSNSVDAKTLASHLSCYKTPRCNFKSSEKKAEITLKYIQRHVETHLDKAQLLDNGKPDSDAEYQLNMALCWLVRNAHQLPQEDVTRYQTAILDTHQSIYSSLDEKNRFLDDHIAYARFLQDARAREKPVERPENPAEPFDRDKNYVIQPESIDCVIALADQYVGDGDDKRKKQLDELKQAV